MKIFYYTVTEEGSFPLYMLRYDRAFPRRGEDSTSIEYHTLRSVSLSSDCKPSTVARWRFFGWAVDQEEVQKV